MSITFLTRKQFRYTFLFECAEVVNYYNILIEHEIHQILNLKNDIRLFKLGLILDFQKP